LLKSGKITYSWFKWVNKSQLLYAHVVIITGHTDKVTSCAWSSDGKRLLSVSYDETGRVWDANTGKELHTLEGRTSELWACAWSNDGKRILLASDEVKLSVWDANTSKILNPKSH
jgi:WD40 repeat protein